MHIWPYMMNFSMTGRVLGECEIDVDAAVESLEYYSGLLHTLFGQHIPMLDGSYAYTRREPLGVCVGMLWLFFGQ